MPALSPSPSGEDVAEVARRSAHECTCGMSHLRNILRLSAPAPELSRPAHRDVSDQQQRSEARASRRPRGRNVSVELLVETFIWFGLEQQIQIAALCNPASLVSNGSSVALQRFDVRIGLARWPGVPEQGSPCACSSCASAPSLASTSKIPPQFGECLAVPLQEGRPLSVACCTSVRHERPAPRRSPRRARALPKDSHGNCGDSTPAHAC